MYFSVDPALDPPVLTETGPSGAWPFGARLTVVGQNAFYLYPSTPGCYALTAHGPGWAEAIVIEAVV